MLESSISTRSLNRLIATHAITVALVICLLCTGCHVSESLSIVTNTLFVTKLICCYLLLANLSLAVSLETEIVTAKPSRNAKHQIGRLFRAGCRLLGASCVAHVIAVLFGAPFIASAAETFHFASLLAFTTVLPCLCIIGPSVSTWISAWSRHRNNAALEWGVLMSSGGAVVGAWLGAFPIPLDWDRPWQVWPISCVIGTLIGYSVGLVISCWFLLSRHRRQRKTKSG